MVTHPELVIAVVNVASSDWAGRVSPSPSSEALLVEEETSEVIVPPRELVFHLAWLKSEAAANEKDKPLQIAECEA